MTPRPVEKRQHFIFFQQERQADIRFASRGNYLAVAWGRIGSGLRFENSARLLGSAVFLDETFLFYVTTHFWGKAEKWKGIFALRWTRAESLRCIFLVGRLGIESCLSFASG